MSVGQQDDAAELARAEFVGRFANGNLKGLVDVIRNEVGTDEQLLRQAIADYFAIDRQNLRDHFEGRLEYARHVGNHRTHTLTALVEYGVQTLKWSFLLNAGAIAVVMAYINAAVGKSGASVSAYMSVIRELWPFAVGCLLVTLAGATAFFNFSYAEAALPSAETLNLFLSRGAVGWPAARYQKPNESQQEFMERFGWKVVWARSTAITLAFGSIGFFALGVFLMMRTAMIS